VQKLALEALQEIRTPLASHWWKMKLLKSQEKKFDMLWLMEILLSNY
jgi:hypothetical protein